jgi:hypothetical protein
VKGDLYGWTRLQGFVHPTRGTLLLRANGENTVWIVRNRVRQAIPSADCFNDMCLRWDQVRVVPRYGIETYTWANPIQHLIQTPGDPTVYWVRDGRKCGLANPDILIGEGFYWSDIIYVSAQRRDSYPTGERVASIVPNFIVVDGTYVTQRAPRGLGSRWPACPQHRAPGLLEPDRRLGVGAGRVRQQLSHVAVHLCLARVGVRLVGRHDLQPDRTVHDQSGRSREWRLARHPRFRPDA